METAKYSLTVILTTALLYVLYVTVSAYAPCAFYPRAYFQAITTDQALQEFQLKHGRLPDMLDEQDVSELDLGTGYRASFDRGTGSYKVFIDPDGERDFVYSVSDASTGNGADASKLQYMSFDGPWVEYESLSRKIQCGHR